MSGELVAFLANIVCLVPAFLISLSVHESAHAGMAYLLGDDTAKRSGRISLNPLRHIDPMGLLCLVLFRIGWAKPVIFDHRNFKRPKLYSVLTAYAGPFSNFILALIAFVCIKFFPFSYFSSAVIVSVGQILHSIAYVSVMLGVFNLLPIPPLDGSHLLMVLLMDKHPRILAWLYRYSLIFIVMLFFIPQVRILLMRMIFVVYDFLYGIVF